MNEEFIYALTIKERIQAFEDKGMTCSEDLNIIEEEWFSVNHLGDRELFLKQLEAMDITSEQFAFGLKKYIGGDIQVLYEFLEKQDWYQKFMLFMEADEKNNKTDTYYERQKWVRPFGIQIQGAIEKLKFKNIVLETKVLNKLSADIISSVMKISWKCIVIELAEFKENHTLNGKTGEERYLDFTAQYFKTTEDVIQFYRKYPVMARLMTQKSLDLVRECTKMLKNLDSSYEELKVLLGLESNKVIEVKYGAGDTHAHGKTVSIFKFEDDRKAVYKPRDARSLQKYHEFLDKLNSRFGELSFYKSKALYKQDFLIEEFIEFKECETEQDVKDFYYHFGKLIGLAGILHISDLHCENVIAHKDWPVIIDLETILCHVEGMKNDLTDKGIPRRKEVFQIQETALLPNMALKNNIENKGVDLSALAGGHAGEFPKKVLQLKYAYTDEMRFEEDEVKMSEWTNTPRYQGKVIDYKRYLKEIYEGYNKMVDFVFKEKEFLTAQLDDTLSNIEVRHVLRDTSVYGAMVGYMDYPTYLMNMNYMERMLSNFYSSGGHLRRKAVVEEINSMLNQDIPIFFESVNDTYLKSGDGVIIPDIYDEPIMDIIKESINYLDENTAKKERDKLKVILSSRHDGYLEENVYNNESALEESDHIYEHSEIIKICTDMAEDIIEGSVTRGDLIGWDTIKLDENMVHIYLSDTSIYNGGTGIFLYLRNLIKISEDKKIEEFADKLQNTIEDCMVFGNRNVYNGAEGYLYALINLDDKRLKEDPDKYMMWLRSSSIKDKEFDFVNGSASYIRLIEKVIAEYPEHTWVQRETEKWYMELCKWLRANETPTVGLGHGDIGILYALLIVQKIRGINVSNEASFLINKISEKIKNLDLEGHHMNNSHKASWCNGIAGLGQGGVACSRYVKHDWFEYYKNLGLSYVAQNDDPNMCICHGLSGDIDFLLNCGAVYTGEQEIDRILRRKVNKIITYYQKNRRLLLTETDAYRNYGFMTGLSGVGYTLLRVLNPELQSILLLD